MTLTAYKALDFLLKQSDVQSVLDVGSGAGHHAAAMRKAGKLVVTNSLEEPADILGDFMEIAEDAKYNAIWAAHVLEHQPNPGMFLKKCFRMLDDGGLFVVTVPPLKHEIVGGHINLYNGGLLIYQCVLAGFDCSAAKIMCYSYNISLLVRKKEAILPKLRMDEGDIETLARFFPFKVKQGFNGDIRHV